MGGGGMGAIVSGISTLSYVVMAYVATLYYKKSQYKSLKYVPQLTV